MEIFNSNKFRYMYINGYHAESDLLALPILLGMGLLSVLKLVFTPDVDYYHLRGTIIFFYTDYIHARYS